MSRSPLSASLVRTLDTIEVADDLLSATVEGHDVEAESPHEMRRELSSKLYEVIHAGQRTDPNDIPFQLRDRAFEAVLSGALPHERTTAVGVLRGPVPDDDSPVLIERDGVRVWMPREHVALPDGVEPGTPLALSVVAARPALSPGFFLIDGSAPQRLDGPALRVYVHLAYSDAALPLWSRVLAFLEGEQVPYRSKVLSARLLYPRRDALVVYLREGAWEVHQGIVEVVTADPAGVGEETSAFARRLAPGVAMAWEPTDTRSETRGMSFGQHRASIIAQGLVTSVREGRPRDEAVAEALLAAQIDPRDPWRNTTSPEVAAAAAEAAAGG